MSKIVYYGKAPIERRLDKIEEKTKEINAEVQQTYNKEEVDAALNDKQNKLISSTNVKTINGQSILGGGNLTFDNISINPYDGAIFRGTYDIDLHKEDFDKHYVGSTTNGVNTSTGRYSTDYIPVFEGMVIDFLANENINNSAEVAILAFDSNKTFSTSDSVTTKDVKDKYDNNVPYRYTVPSGIRYLIFQTSYLNSPVPPFVKSRNSEFDTIEQSVTKLERSIYEVQGTSSDFTTDSSRPYYGTASAKPITNLNRKKTLSIPVCEGCKIKYDKDLFAGAGVYEIACLDDKNELQSSKSLDLGTKAITEDYGEFTIQSGIVKVILACQTANNPSFTITKESQISVNKNNISINKDNIEKNNVEIDKINEKLTGDIVISNDMFTTDATVPYYGSTGSTNTNTGRKRTDKIKVYPGYKIYCYGLSAGGNVCTIAAFDKEGNFNANNSVPGTFNNGIYTVPSGIFYVSFCCWPGNNDAYCIILIKDTSSLTHYIPFHNQLLDPNYSIPFGTWDDIPYYDINGAEQTSINRQRTHLIPVKEGDEILYQTSQNDLNVLALAAFDEDRQLVLGASVVEKTFGLRKYIVPSGIRYVQCCSTTTTINPFMVIGNNVNYNLKKKQKIDNTKMYGFEEFTAVNNGWEISSDNKTIQNEALGYNNRITGNIVSFTDRYNIGCTIIPQTNYFEAVIGKWWGGSGSTFGIKKTADGCFIVPYIIVSTTNGGEPQVVTAIREQEISSTIKIEQGKPCYIRVEKYINWPGDNTDGNYRNDYQKVTITDILGNTDSFTFPSTVVKTNGAVTGIGNGWGPVTIYVNEGTVKFEEFSFGFNMSDQLTLLFIGHSFVEANTMQPIKARGYAYKIMEAIGPEHCMCWAKGGESAQNICGSEYMAGIMKWFGHAKYAIIHLGGNDILTTVDSEWQKQYRTWIQAINDTLVNNDIIPIWLGVTYGVADTCKLNRDNDITNSWMEEHFEHYIDLRPIFEDAEGNVDRSKFLNDGIHPTETAQQQTADVILARFPFLLNK